MDNVMLELLQEVRDLRVLIERQAGKKDVSINKPMTREQAAEFLDVHPDTLYRYVAEGKIRHFRLGDGDRAPLRFLLSDLEAFMRQGEVPSISELRGRAS